jgi:hypothetical protein
LGSTSYATDTNGEVYQHLEYFPFGETWADEVTNDRRVPYRFTGKEFDEETKLYLTLPLWNVPQDRVKNTRYWRQMNVETGAGAIHA